jgi:hypothetical protein
MPGSTPAASGLVEDEPPVCAPPVTGTPPDPCAPPAACKPPIPCSPPVSCAPPVPCAPPETCAPPLALAPPETCAPPLALAPPETCAPPVPCAPPVCCAPPVPRVPPDAEEVSRPAPQPAAISPPKKASGIMPAQETRAQSAILLRSMPPSLLLLGRASRQSRCAQEDLPRRSRDWDSAGGGDEKLRSE